MLSVVIVNFNAGPLLTTNLRALSSALADEAWQAIVVDNGSHDGSMQGVEALQREGAPLILVYNRANLGFAAACNRGAGAASGEWLLFLNPDVTVPRGTIPAVRDALLADPSAGMAGCLLVNPDGSEQRGCRRDFPNPVSAFYRISRLARLAPKRFPDFNHTGGPLPANPTAVPAISGAFMLMQRTTFEALGGWDEGYFLHMEDLDLCRRLADSGGKTLFVPTAQATHVQGSCSRATPFRVEWHKHRSMWRFHRKFDAPHTFALWNALVWGGIWLHLLLRGVQLGIRRGRH